MIFLFRHGETTAPSAARQFIGQTDWRLSPGGRDQAAQWRKALLGMSVERIIAEALGLPLSAIRVMSGDTDMGVDLGAYSSRQTLMTGHAVKKAAEDVKRQVLDVLAVQLKISADEMDMRQGKIIFKNPTVDYSALRNTYIKEHRGWTDNPKEDHLTFKEASRLAYLEKGTIVGTGKYKPKALGGKFKGATVGTSPA
jgi:4-hydroxybenzoyl-CoA reductase subunit alpha